jgi:hypothetical protein
MAGREIPRDLNDPLFRGWMVRLLGLSSAGDVEALRLFCSVLAAFESAALRASPGRAQRARQTMSWIRNLEEALKRNPPPIYSPLIEEVKKRPERIGRVPYQEIATQILLDLPAEEAPKRLRTLRRDAKRRQNRGRKR